jgi:hypothetical protein
VNLFGIQIAARVNLVLAARMGIVIAIFFVAAAHYLFQQGLVSQVSGTIWMAIGVAYDVLQTLRYRDDLIDFGVPPVRES